VSSLKVNKGMFQPGNQAAKNRGRRAVTENLVTEFLTENGKALLLTMLQCVNEQEDLEARSRSADRLMKHLLLHPKNNDEDVTESPDTSVFRNAGLTSDEAILLRDRAIIRQSQVVDELIIEIVNERTSVDPLK
jgi:hypothetical protein